MFRHPGKGGLNALTKEVFYTNAYPAAGKPLYEAQKSDFLKCKVANLRGFWRIWRNCAKKIFAQIWSMCWRMCQICKGKKIARIFFAQFSRLHRPLREIVQILRNFAPFIYIWHKLDVLFLWKLGSGVVRVADLRLEFPVSNLGSYFFAIDFSFTWFSFFWCKFLNLQTLIMSAISTHRVLT